MTTLEKLVYIHDVFSAIKLLIKYPLPNEKVYYNYSELSVCDNAKYVTCINSRYFFENPRNFDYFYYTYEEKNKDYSFMNKVGITINRYICTSCSEEELFQLQLVYEDCDILTSYIFYMLKDICTSFYFNITKSNELVHLYRSTL